MRKRMLLSALALLASVLLPATALAAAGGSDLPTRASHSGFCTVNVATGQAHCLSTGWWSHLGWSTVDQDLQIVATGPGWRTWSATWTVTAASGDELFGTGSGTTSLQDAVHATSVGQYVTTGGTGRLADVSVIAEITGHLTLLSVEGTIATQAFEVTLVGRLGH